MDLDRIPEIAKYLSVTFMVAWMGRNTVWYFLPVFFEEHISSVFLIGLLTSISSIIPILFDIPVGQTVQRLGARIVIFVGLLTSIVPGIMYLTTIPMLMVVGKVFEGLVKVLVWNGGWSLTLQSSDQEVESESVSVFLLGVNLAAVISPIIGGYLIAAYGFSITFYLWSFTAVLSVLVFYAYIGLSSKEPVKQGMEEVLSRKTYVEEWHDLKNYWRQLALPYSLIFLFSIIFSFYWVAIPLLLERVNAEYQMMGIVFGLAALPKVFQFIFGDMADRIGRLKTLAGLSLILIPVLVGMNFISGVMMIGAFFFIARIISEGMSPAIHAIFDQRAPDDLQSEFTGFFEFSKHVGTAVGPILAGTVAEIWSVSASFLSAAGVSLVILVVALYGLSS
jgi:MFS family permease